MNKDIKGSNHLNPDLLTRARSIMEWSNLIIVATAALGITAWFTSHFVLFYITDDICLVLGLIFLLGPVFIGISEPRQGKILNGILFFVIGILVTHKIFAGILLGGCFFGLCGMLPLAVQLHKERQKRKKGTDSEKSDMEPMADDEDRNARINRMSVAFNRLSEVSDILVDRAPELEDLAPASLA